MHTRNMTYIALMAVVISVCSWLSVPMTISFTMQTFAIFTALLLLGGIAALVLPCVAASPP